MSEEADNSQIINACKAAEEFMRIYYECFDQKRHMMIRTYMDNATLTWDGNAFSGKEQIAKFFENFPETEHLITALDSQPVIFDAVKGQQTIIVQTAGTIRIGREKVKGFSQSFVITAQENKWKIVTDCRRLQVVLTNKS